jgi:homoserine kinase
LALRGLAVLRSSVSFAIEPEPPLAIKVTVTADVLVGRGVGAGAAGAVGAVGATGFEGVEYALLPNLFIAATVK